MGTLAEGDATFSITGLSATDGANTAGDSVTINDAITLSSRASSGASIAQTCTCAGTSKYSVPAGTSYSLRGSTLTAPSTAVIRYTGNTKMTSEGSTSTNP